MRFRRYALIVIFFSISAILIGLLSSPSQEAQWQPVRKIQPQKTMLLSNESLMPIAVFAAAVLAFQAKQAAAAQAAAASIAASSVTEAASPTVTTVTTPPSPSGSTSPTTTTTTAPAASGADADWQQVSICEEGGSNSPTFGYFGIMPSTWAAYGGTAYSPLAGGSDWATQVMIGDKINGGPPWAPAGCAGAGYSGW
jgi:hypothetical protein